ncbi:hypothetical protein MXB_2459 [Myxobolus squamalis]|nr:hypothetical protein MXB_2459 [Myxobolus squamalis]
MSVQAQVGTLISSLLQGSEGVKPSKSTPHLLSLEQPNLKGICSWGKGVGLY